MASEYGHTTMDSQHQGPVMVCIAGFFADSLDKVL